MNTKEFLINKSYGGFGYSQEAMDEYNRRIKEIVPKAKPIKSQCPDYQDVARDNPIMIQIVKELGPRANDKWSNLQIISIPHEYYVGVEIETHDGMEVWRMNFLKYKLHKIEEVLLSSGMQDYEKIAKIYSIISAVLTLENLGLDR